jgi:hypothetical protein
LSRIFTLIILIISLISCECPPSADTPREIVPTEFAKIVLFNGIYSFSYINIGGKYGDIKSQIFWTETTKSYQKIASGSNIIFAKNLNTVFYSIPAFLSKDKYYSAILVGGESDPNLLLFQDSLELSDKESARIRFINAAKYIDMISFANNSKVEISELKYAQASEYKKFPEGLTRLSVSYQGNSIIDFAVDLKSGGVYNILVFYNPSAANKYNLSWSIIKSI